MSTTLQDTLATLADGAAARAGRSDDAAHRATLDGLLGTVRRRRAVRQTGTAVASGSLVAALAVGGSQLTGSGGARGVPGATGPGGLTQADQLALVNDLGIQCGKPFTLKTTSEPFRGGVASVGSERPVPAPGLEVTVGYHTSAVLGLADPKAWSMAAVVVRGGTVVGFGAGRPTDDALEATDGAIENLRLRLPSLMNCDGPDAPAPDGQYDVYTVEGMVDGAGITQVTAVLAPMRIPVPAASPDEPSADGPKTRLSVTEFGDGLGTTQEVGPDTITLRPPALGGSPLVVRYAADLSVAHDADGTIPLWTSENGGPLVAYDGTVFSATWDTALGAVVLAKDGTPIARIALAPAGLSLHITSSSGH